MKINNVTPIYTGGNIYVFVGKIDDNYFIACDSFYDVRIVNANPLDYNGTFLGDHEWCYPEWQETHLVRDVIDRAERRKIFRKILKWIIKNEPNNDNCNYLLGDMEDILEDLD